MPMGLRTRNADGISHCGGYGRSSQEWLRANETWVRENGEEKLEMASADNSLNEFCYTVKGMWSQERVFLG